MITQVCALCERNNFRVIYNANFDTQKVDARIFSARRLPDRIHFRMVQCKTCHLLYSNPIFELKKIANLYKKSFTNYDDQIDNLVATYGYYLKKLDRFSPQKGKFLEIGCGNGFFLQEAKRQGYKNVYGVEPGKQSVQKAPREIRKHIIPDIFKKGQFKVSSIDVLCCFQTFDHVPNPNAFLKNCYTVLKQGGIVLFLNHDATALSAKLLGEKSPIIDIEHTYLYNKKTMRQMFEKHGFTVLSVKNAFNIHYLSYWLYLLPLPSFIKAFFTTLLKMTNLFHARIKIYPGNLVLIAKK